MRVHNTLFNHAQRLCAGFAALALIAGCATKSVQPTAPAPSAQVALELLPPGTEGRAALKQGQSTDGKAGEAEHLPLPQVPPPWLAALQTPLRVELRVVIDGQGRVSELTPDLQQAVQRCGVCAQAFAAAIEAAAQDWRFHPFEISDWQEVDEDGDGEVDSLRRVTAERRPYSLRLALTFALIDGQAAVNIDVPARAEAGVSNPG